MVGASPGAACLGADATGVRRAAREPVAQVDAMPGQHAPHQAEAVGVCAGGGDAHHGVAVADLGRPPELVAGGHTDREAGQVEVVGVGEVARVLPGLAAEQDALGTQAALVDAADDVGDALRDELAHDQIVEEEQGRRRRRRRR